MNLLAPYWEVGIKKVTTTKQTANYTTSLPAMSHVTQLLDAARLGDAAAADELLPLVYDELRRLAAQKLSKENEGQTLQPTALVHEAWLRLAGDDAGKTFANRAHFFSAAAEAMRRILIERARRKASQKRGGKWERIDLQNLEIASDANEDTLLVVNEALEKLEKEDPHAAEIVKLRFFVGLTLDEAGQAMGVTERTAKRYWAYARAWLYKEIKASATSG
jgi:RNA polymerase sigma factor (TIGR02999 family)